MNPTRARAATIGVFALNGFILGMWIVNIPTIKDRTDIDQATLGLLLLALGAAAWIGMQLAGRAIDRFGSRPVLTVAAVAVSLSLPGPAFATNATQLAIALAVIGFFNGIVDVSQNAQAVVVERAYRRPIMAAFHAFFSLGGLVAAGVGGLLIAADVDVRVTLCAAAAIGVLVALSLRTSYLVEPELVASSPG